MNDKNTCLETALNSYTDNREIAEKHLTQFMQQLEDRLDTGKQAGDEPALFYIELLDNHLGISIYNDKYRVQLILHPTALPDGGTNITCLGKSIDDDTEFCPHMHWLDTLYLSNDGYLCVIPKLVPKLTIQRPFSLHLDMYAESASTWGRYLFSITKSRVRQQLG